METQTKTERHVPLSILQAEAEAEVPVTTPQEPDTSQPKASSFKILSAGISFFVAGTNDGSLGSLIPYVMRSYGINANMISILYGCAFLGWLIAALSNTSLTRHFDLGWMLTFGAVLQIIAQTLRTWFPPLPLYAITFCIASLGQALNDTHANVFVSSLERSHRYLGFIHAMYMAGCLIGPLVATAVASSVKTKGQWSLFYLFPLGIGVINLTLIAIFFRDRFCLKFKLEPNSEARSTQKTGLTEIKATLSTPAVWLLSLFFFFFLGAAITAGGWMVEYLVVVRNAKTGKIGYALTGLYGGGFLGRLALAEPTYRLGERRMVFIYAMICVALQLVFWLVPSIITEAVAASLLGFFSGPFFATGINVGTRIFSPEIRSSAIAFVFVLGQIGGSIFPAITGIIATQCGVQVLQPMLVGLFCATGVSWLILPKDKELPHQD